MGGYGRILIIKPGAMGDLLQITPVIRALKNRYPAAAISVMVGNAPSVDLFRHHPDVDEVIVFDKRGEHSSFGAFMRLWLQLRSGRYDLVVNFQRSNLKGWLLAAAAFPCRVVVYHKARSRTVHAVADHLAAVATLGLGESATGLELDFFPGSEAERWAEAFFVEHELTGRQVIALNPGASHPVNRWSTDSFARLADLLTSMLHVPVIVVGGKGDQELCQGIASAASTPLIDMGGRTSLLQLGALLKRCSLLVSGDTGPMHMATAVGTKVVALFGAADPGRTGPVGGGHKVVQAPGLSCIPCRSRQCSSNYHLECMERITAEQVFAVISSILSLEADECGS